MKISQGRESIQMLGAGEAVCDRSCVLKDRWPAGGRPSVGDGPAERARAAREAVVPA